MRGGDAMQESLFTVAKLEDFVPEDHPLRTVRQLVNSALAEMNGRFNEIYAPGGRDYETQYRNFLAKFQSDLAANGRAINQLAGRKRLNVDQVVTEFANRTAQRAPTDKEFCARAKRAFDWALSQQVTTLTQVPPPYDLGPDMNVFPCPTP